MAAVEYVADIAQYEALEKQDGVLCVYFTASWCGPCQRVAPDIDALAATLKHVRFSKIDVDNTELQTVVTSMDVSSVPMFVFRKQGKTLHTIIGANLPEITQFAQTVEGAAAAQAAASAEEKKSD